MLTELCITLCFLKTLLQSALSLECVMQRGQICGTLTSEHFILFVLPTLQNVSWVYFSLIRLKSLPAPCILNKSALRSLHSCKRDKMSGCNAATSIFKCLCARVSPIRLLIPAYAREHHSMRKVGEVHELGFFLESFECWGPWGHTALDIAVAYPHSANFIEQVVVVVV